MKIVKTVDLILLLILAVTGTLYEICPRIIPDWLFNTMWIVGPIALITFGIVIYTEKKQNKK